MPKTDTAFADEARAELAKLQSGDAESRAIWERFIAITRRELDVIYARMGVTFEEWNGESFYDPMLPRVAQTVIDSKLAREDQGAL